MISFVSNVIRVHQWRFVKIISADLFNATCLRLMQVKIPIQLFIWSKETKGNTNEPDIGIMTTDNEVISVSELDLIRH